MLSPGISRRHSRVTAAARLAGGVLVRASATLGVVRAVLLAVTLLLAVSAQAGTYPARVVAITDGNTLRAVHEGREITVRLRWIDSPETGQRYSSQAKQALGELVGGQVVTVRDFGSDAHGRRLADVVLPDGRNVNRELVRLGWAWWFRKYSRDVTLGTLEADARAARRGLWADAHPVPPWEWRASQVSDRDAPRIVTPAKLSTP
jgi:endonuclease YncB( thermonuclease family)